jgi:hypothetical protein
MTQEEMQAELDKCAKDVEYTLRTYCTIIDKDGTRRRPTEIEIAHAIKMRDKKRNS